MSSQPNFKRGEEVAFLRNIARVAVPFYSTTHELSVTVPYGSRGQQVFGLRTKPFKLWLMDRFEAEYGCPPGPSALRTVVDHLEARTICEQLPIKPMAPRRLTYDRKIVLDLADPDSECIEITPAGWNLTDAANHAFTRTPGTASLPHPEPPAPDTLDDFRALLNITPGDDWTRVVTFLTAAMTGFGPRPILVLQGPSGSCKTTTARMLKAVLDPVTNTPGPLPDSLAALRKYAAAHHIVVFDDIHGIHPVKAAEIARIADDQAQTRAVILVRSCDSTGPLPDALQRRALTITLQQPYTVRTLYDLRNHFERVHAGVLGALCDAAVEALRRLHETAEPASTRLADTALITIAAAPALGLAPASILQAIAEIPRLYSAPVSQWDN